jgi:hypothetical protein
VIKCYTKKEFSEEFGYKHVSAVTHLIADGKIETEPDGTIKDSNKKNAKWIKARRKELKKKELQETPPAPDKPTKQEPGNIGLEIQILNEKLNERQKKSTLLDLKIAKERKEVVETEVLNRVIMTVFDTLFKNLTELPSIYADDIFSIVKSSKSKEELVKFLTDKIISHIRSGLDVAENTAKKYYE